jgi:glutamate synthase domain-containing protein 3
MDYYNNKQQLKIKKMEQVTDLNHSPKLKQFLKLYVSRMYEEEALYDDWHLFQEYIWLRNNNQLDELFKEECLTNRLNDERYTG